MAIRVVQRIGWVLIALGIVLAAVFVSGLSHPVSPQDPSTVTSYGMHHRWVVVGFTLSMVGAATLLVTETFRRSRGPQATTESQDPSA